MSGPIVRCNDRHLPRYTSLESRCLKNAQYNIHIYLCAYIMAIFYDAASL